MKKNLRLSTLVAMLFCNPCLNFLHAQGCPGLASITLNVVAAPQPDINGPAEFCAGTTAVLDVPQTFSSYSWSNGASTQSISVGTAGTYTVTVTNAAGCTGVDAFTINESTAPSPSITVSPYTCNGQLDLNAGAGFSSYSWSTGATINPISISNNGDYTVTVSNAFGCTGVATLAASIPPPPSVSISGANTFCANAGTNLSASSGLSAYSWSTGQSGQDITVTSAGVYTVTATDAFGCTTTANTTLSTIPAPTPGITGPAAICTGTSGTLTVVGTYNSYAWSTTESGPSITVSNAGTYTVTVTDNNGCTGTDTENLSLLPLPQPNITALPYQCNGQLTINAGAGFVVYTWSGGQTTNAITANTNGDYTVTVTDNNGCTGIDNFTVNIPPDPLVTISGASQFCANATSVLTASPGFSNYTWSGGQNGASISVSIAGTYTVTATDAFGCTDTENFTVATVPAPVPDIAGPGNICEGQNASLSVPGSFVTYNWSNGLSGDMITVSAAGVYTVTVTDNNGCTGTASESVDVLPVPQPSISALPYQCNGQITLTASGGFSAYTWSNGETANNITVSNNDVYSVTVTAANGCTGADAFLVDIPAAPVVAVTGPGQFCENETILLQATAGFNGYIWSNGQFTPNIQVGTGGVYTITVTDNFGCTASNSLLINELPAPAPTISGPGSVCSNQFAGLSVQNGFSTYVWSSGQFTPSINVGPGVYTVTVSDPNGCTAEATRILNSLAAPQPDITAAPYNCDEQLSLSVLGGFSNYNWSNGQTGATTTVFASDDYTVTVTSANGCTGTDVYFADVPALPLVNISGAPTFCQGGSTILSASGGFSTYAWSSGQLSQNITVTATGNYEVTATDGNGCTATNIFSVQSLNAPTPAIAGPTGICAGSSATFNVPGTYNAYAWSTGQNTPTIVVSVAGDYTVTVTAANGCTGTDVQTLVLSTSLTPEIGEQPYNCDGQITLEAGGGFLSYQWSGGQLTPTISVNASGDYSVTVTDASGCSGSDVISVIIPSQPIVGINGVSAICQNTIATLNASTGFAGYAWSNSQVGPTINTGLAGQYIVTATDNFGCTSTAGFTLNVNPLPNANISGPTIICINSSGSLSAPLGLSAYLWSTSDTGAGIIVTGAGTYTVTVTDSNGCSNTAAASVTVTTQLAPQINTQPYACNGFISLDAGTGFSSYTWSSGQNSASINALNSGMYTVTVSDANGCTGTDAFDVLIPAQPVVSIVGNPIFCAGTTTVLNAGPGFSNYAWSTGEGTPSINSGINGSVTVTVTDALGCTATGSIQLTPQPLPQPIISGPSSICAGSSATLQISGATGNIQWSTGDQTASITTDVTGVYSLTITDSNGCVGTANAALTVNNNPTTQITQAPYQCDGQISLNADPGFVQYVWTGGQSGSTFLATQSGLYSVTVTDANACTAAANLDVVVPILQTVGIQGSPQFCPGAATTLQATSGFIGYQWTVGSANAGIVVNQAGIYNVTATDAEGCTSTAGITVLELPTPQPVIAGPLAVCPGSTANLTAPAGYVSYSWSTGDNTTSIVVTPPTSVTLTVTDGNGCVGTAAAIVDVSNQISPNIQVQTDPCTGTATLDAGPGYLSYAWSVGSQSGALITVNQSGSYSVTVNDGNGCTGSSNVMVDIPIVQTVAIAGTTTFCTGSNATLTATPGFGAYLWSTGETGNTISVSQSGVFTITATDALGCTSTASTVATAFPIPVPGINGPQSVCPGSNATLSVTGGFTGIQWSTGATTASITQPAPFTATVTVTDANGCAGTATATVSISNQLSPSILAIPPVCPGDATLDAGAGYQNYVWNTMQTTQQINVSLSGTYTVTVSDGNGCSGTASVTINLPVAPEVIISGISPFCDGDTTVLNASGGYTDYQWSNGQNGISINTSLAGVYTVTATNAVGCTATASFSLTALPLPTPFILGPGSLCGNSSVNLSLSGGIFMDIEWSNGNSNTTSISINTPGAYSVTVTNINGCTATDELIVQADGNVAVSAIINPYNCDGALSVTADAGFVSYSWSNGANQPTASFTQSGTYTVTVTDNANCTGVVGIEVNIPPAPQVSVSGTNNFCQGTSGSLNANPGFAAYTWNTGETSASIVVDTEGMYTVTVTDASGCTATAEQAVLVQEPVNVILNASTCRQQLAGVATTTYIGANGCDSIVTVVTSFVANNPDLTLDLASPLTVNTGEAIELDVASAGNFTIDSVGYTSPFVLSCINCLNPNFIATVSGTIWVTAYDADGCSASDQVLINVKNRAEIYVPDAFQPGSGDNGFFSVFSDAGIQSVRNFSVFDRWGNALFSRPDLPTNDPTAGWDGYFRGQAMQPGVYVYYFEVAWPDGTKEVYRGDVTILR